MTLADFLAEHQGLEPDGHFPALLGAEAITVRAVLERTAIVHPAHDDTDRRVVRLTAVTVRPDLMRWKTDAGGRFSENGAPFVRGQRAFNSANTAPKTSAERLRIRAQTDAAALASRKPSRPVVINVVVKRKPNRSLEAKERAKVVAQRLRRQGAPKLCRSCQQLKPRSAFPVGKQGQPSCLACQVKTHCSNGHSLTPENTVIRNRQRACRVCINEQQRLYRLRNPKQSPGNPERHRRYYAEHRDAVRERKRKYYLRKKEAA